MPWWIKINFSIYISFISLIHWTNKFWGHTACQIKLSCPLYMRMNSLVSAYKMFIPGKQNVQANGTCQRLRSLCSILGVWNAAYLWLCLPTHNPSSGAAFLQKTIRNPAPKILWAISDPAYNEKIQSALVESRKALRGHYLCQALKDLKVCRVFLGSTTKRRRPSRLPRRRKHCRKLENLWWWYAQTDVNAETFSIHSMH